MVQIDAPPAQLMAGASSVDSGAITEDAIVADGHVPADHLPDGSTIAGDPPVESGFAGREDLGNDPTTPAMPDPAGWQSERTRRTRQIALVAMLSMSILMVAVLAFSWFVRSYRNQVAAVQENFTSEQNESSPSDVAEPKTQQMAEADAAGININATSPRAASDEIQVVAPELAASDGDKRVDAAPARQPIIPMDLIPKSPLDPTGADAFKSNNRDGGPIASTDDPDASKLMNLPPGLSQYIPFLLQESPSEKPTLRTPPTMDDIAVDGAAQDDLDPFVTVEPRTLNLKSDLAIKLAFRSEGYSLADLVLMISQITGVPIQIDWVSFDFVGVKVATLVKPPKSLTSAREVLDQVATQVGGEVREQTTLLVLTPSDETFGKAFSQIAGLGDFGNGAESAARVLDEFMKLSPPPQQFDDEGNPIDLPETVAAPVSDPRAEQHLVGLATETLRRMRGVEGKVVDPTLHRWAHASSAVTEWPKVVAGNAGPQIDTPIALAGFLKRISRLNGSSCLVNWHDANLRQATPDRMMLPNSGDGMERMLTRALSPLGLHVRQVDSDHWWVGSDSTYDRLPVVVASEPLGPTRDAFQERIEKIMFGATRDEYRFVFDDDSDRALMLLPRFVVRQLSTVTERLAVQ